ncbi:type VI secretion system tip protein VgrG [Massilia forsythiae]|uniref:Type VI secretion system tip protein VgrG n=1 Tax=Massilia forsythiae TaxID=2728020 RepID=A0A7Z2VZ03_9BURK|nr:type VI secretion system Vgr family protein [Massilia forsythiae]QJE02011.1 type VI secretion system tip protein VgrG [Massilia forsythiae]
MSQALLAQIATSLVQFSAVTRLLELRFSGDEDAPDLLVEAFAADDVVHGLGARDVIALSTDAHLELAPLLGRQATLEISLADGTRTRFSGDVTRAALLGSEGGFARYRLRLTPWLWRLTQTRNSRVWQDKRVTDIVDEVLAAFAPLAQWRWSGEVDGFLSAVAARSYCCQYRESDYDFILRLLTEEGIAWRFEQVEDGHRMVLFADSTRVEAIPEDASSAAGGGIRFHGARAGERRDTIQALHARRRLVSGMTTLLSYDYKAKKSVGAGVAARRRAPNLPLLESYDTSGQYSETNAAEAAHHARVRMEAREAPADVWQGRSTVRTLAAGTRIGVTQGPLAAFGAGTAPAYTVLEVTSIGVNNLPVAAQQGLAELFGPIPELLEETLRDRLQEAPDRRACASDELPLAIAQARESGYANLFEAVPADVVWRPMLPGSDGRSHPKPTVFGAQSAIVIGADGQDQPGGADELYCDALGRVRIRFHWQDEGNASCWVRVAQRAAGGGMGSQFLPRIGQEVLVQFIENDIDRPLVVGALYNGQGEGGSAPTPGGAAGADADPAALFGAAADHMPSGQGNLAGGNGPLWHGASADSGGHRNPAAQWGVRSKEFGGQGYNQLLFDDTDAQGRVQLRSTHALTELTLGHLVHAADNYRGSLRGQGAELRTDAHGAVRAGAGLLVSSYGIAHAATAREPAGDNPAGIALLKQAVKLAETFDKAASTHRTVGLAVHQGAAKPNASTIDPDAAPLPALLKAVSGMVGDAGLEAARADAAAKDTAPGAGKLPHPTDPVVAISARAGLAVTAQTDVQLVSGEAVALMSGGDSQFVGGGQLRTQAIQAIGVLGGAVAPGENGIGIQAIAARDAIDVQAQADVLDVQARDDVAIVSAQAAVEWAAAKRISLSTAGGANITIDDGNITVQCPGKITIHAGKKSFTGPASIGADMPTLPRGVLNFDEKFQLVDPVGDPIANMRYEILKEDGGKIAGVTDGEGMIPLQHGMRPERLDIRILGRPPYLDN